MAETIKGGAYQSADGSWHDAKGKPLPSSKIGEAEALAAQRAEEMEEAEAMAAGAEALTELSPVVAKPKSARKSTRKSKEKANS
jgi:hypothetical protein